MADIDQAKLDRLWAEYKFRSNTVRRLYPGARIRVCSGGPMWDPCQPPYVLVILPVPEEHKQAEMEHHNVYFDDALTRLQRAISKVLEPDIKEWLARTPVDPESLPLRMRTMCIAFAAMATTAETWAEAEPVWKAWLEKCK